MIITILKLRSIISQRRSKQLLIGAAFLGALSLCLSASVCAIDDNSRPVLIVRNSVAVEQSEITLGAIAEIRAAYGEFDKLVSTLKEINLGEAPPPKMTTSISGLKILETIEATGIKAESLAYSIPKLVLVERKGRTVTSTEMLDCVRAELLKNPELELQIREVSWTPAQVVALGESSCEAKFLGQPQLGRLPLRATVFVNGEASARFLATATVDDWREVPVLKRNVERGMLITPEDVELVRLNLFRQPSDVADDLDQVLGKRAKAKLAAGEALRKNLIDIPPVIPKGSRVKMVYRSGALQASAVGVTMEDGFEQSIIKVRNISSKRVVEAKVINQDEVGVIPQ